MENLVQRLAPKSLTLCAESFDMMKADVMSGKSLSTSGTLVKSKLLNSLFWHSYYARDPVKETLDAHQPKTLFEPRPTAQDYAEPAGNECASVLDSLNKEIVWEYLSIPNAEEEGCEYCNILPAEKQLFPKHQLYRNGNLNCPVLMAMKSAYLHNKGKSFSSKRR
ncbi:uncharacterized protein LOC118507021 [Anopheles stephensi]|uniref:uncharacterized protein LOC118507021 n=1 Tax=Anopheles stephensi TaxID=30069 RepID=UPI001658B15E|nr:uncharacterized protein LOC118507021 [Anopheles stephensi]